MGLRIILKVEIQGLLISITLSVLMKTGRYTLRGGVKLLNLGLEDVASWIVINIPT